MIDFNRERRATVDRYVQGNGLETDVYTDKPTAYETRIALRERFENINILGLPELTGTFYDVMKPTALNVLGGARKGYDADRKNTKKRSQKKFKGHFTFCGMEGHKAAICGATDYNSLEKSQA
jgi:hypothetical protein